MGFRFWHWCHEWDAVGLLRTGFILVTVFSGILEVFVTVSTHRVGNGWDKVSTAVVADRSPGPVAPWWERLPGAFGGLARFAPSIHG